MTRAIIIGVDFDNTIVCYDAVFHRVAVEQGLVPAEVPATKTAVRDHLRRAGKEAAWTELQGVVYGPRIAEAGAFPGVKEFFRECRMRGLPVKIISHKTRFPYAGTKHDLHAAAMIWLAKQGFFAADGIGLSTESVFFEASKPEKLARIAALGCSVFIDDLPEFLAEPDFPPAVRRVLFDPMGDQPAPSGIESAPSWAAIGEKVFGAEDVLAGTGPGAANELFRLAGRRLSGEPVRLAGGGNNRVFEARDDRGERFLLKQYFHRPADPRNRFEAEKLFYGLAAVVVPAQTPKALAWDATERMALLEFVEGTPLAAEKIGPSEVQRALDFFSALNGGRSRPEARALAVAAEACFTVEEHCRTVDRRLARLKKLPPESPLAHEAREFIAGELSAIWQEVRALVVASRAAASAPVRALPVAERCVSPSDFGFHNCLQRADGALVFFDFEYAGWDDPAKTVCDFFCQPALPAPMASFAFFAAGVAQALGLSRPEEFLARCRRLLPVYQVKWCTIMLNEFIRADWDRRAFALGEGAAEKRKTRQLAAARQALAACQQSLHGTAA